MPPGRSASHTPSQSRARAGRSTTNSLRRFNCIESRGWVLPLCYCNYVLSKLDELMANAATTEWEDQEETLARLTHLAGASLLLAAASARAQRAIPRLARATRESSSSQHRHHWITGGEVFLVSPGQLQLRGSARSR
ncbi:uncharacterized protein LOC9658468 [Selaginella moellendorffii]|uniref:uncharacterized protein LOC9658468 n=1 Tax=Selaginella moellendorffii TaxID=88036 RepID=UPI000D1C3450|nr:uncharacterized protein LOC9658468 [Selaginella moellendorffii]|eukprot:XP_024525727.1 uncharacterized protein LOC9658468 [Selaginella moellendorffii]